MKSSMTDFTTAVYEDNGGGLHAIVSSGDTVINVLSGFEDAGLSTSEFINAAQSGFADADAYDPSNYSGISLGAAAAEFAERDDIIAIITSTDVALYPENMGCAGKNLFSVKEDATLEEIFA